MFGNKLFICLTCVIIGCSNVSSWPNIRGANDLISYISIIWNSYFIDNYSEQNIDYLTVQEFIDNFEPLSSALLEIKKDVEAYTNITLDNRVNNQINKMGDEALQIEEIFQYFLEIRQSADLQRSEMKNFIIQIVDKEHGLLRILEVVYFAMVGGKNNLLDLLDENYKEIFYYFQVNSKQQYIYNLLLSVLDTVYKSNAVLNYVCKNLNTRKWNQNFVQQCHQAIKSVNEIYQNAATRFVNVIRRSRRTFHRPDQQKEHQEGLTYVQLENVFQRVFYSKRDFGNSKSCPTNNLSSIVTPACHTRRSTCTIYQRTCPSVFDCKAARPYAVCPLSDSSVTNIRYESVQKIVPQTDLQSLCYGRDVVVTNNQGFCDCLCEEKPGPSSLRAFSLENVTANVIMNYVVVGVKIYRNGGALHLEIEEAKLLPAGFISQKSRKWSRAKATNGETAEYHRITYANGRVINFASVEVAEKDTFVTGVRFAVEGYLGQNVLKIEFQTTKFDFNMGALNQTTSQWLNYGVADTGSEVIDIGELDVPQYANKKHQVDQLNNIITEFEPTGWTSSDFGTSMGPFIDIQCVSPNKAAPLVGINAQYLSAPGSVGYYQLRTVSHNVAEHL